MIWPRLVNDGPGFFIEVLRNERFQLHGRLYGHEVGGEIGIHWIVIDPRRYKLYVWQKTRSDFLASGVALGSPVVTNGSFNLYAGGGRVSSSLRVGLSVGLSAIWEGLKLTLRITPTPADIDQAIERMNADYDEAARLYWSGDVVEGWIIGEREHISICTESRPRAAYFGRGEGRYFGDYVVGRGDPTSEKEVIGGLMRSVENYQPVDPSDTSIGAGYWGLAPLGDQVLQDHGIEDAVAAYHQNEHHDGEQDLPPCDGLLITAYHWGQGFDRILARARVRDAARVDGNDSIMLLQEGLPHVGGQMPKYKRLLQTHGFHALRE